MNRWALSIGIVALLAGCGSQPTSSRVADRSPFDGAIVFVSNMVRPQWDHRVVIIEVRITNVGASSSRLTDWTVSGTEMTGSKVIHGLIMPPSEHRHFGRVNDHVLVSFQYDAQTYLPNEGESLLKPRATIHGLLQVKFSRQVDNRSIKVEFRDARGASYAIDCLACQMVP